MPKTSEATITRFYRVTKGYQMTQVEQLGDLTGLTPEDSIDTVQGGRRVVIHSWMDQDGVNGYEKRVIHLHDWELETS